MTNIEAVRHCRVRNLTNRLHIIAMCHTRDQHDVSEANANLSPSLYVCVDVKTHVPSCRTVETWITLRAPFNLNHATCVYLSTYTLLNWSITARACGTVATSGPSSLLNFLSLFLSLFFRERIFPFHLRSAVLRTPTMQIVFCRKTCRFAAGEASATERM